MKLKEILAQKVERWRKETAELKKEYGDTPIQEVTVEQVLGGMRGIKSLVCETSYLDPMSGIRFRGLTIQETLARLPKRPGNEYASPLGLWHLLLTGEVPTLAEVEELEAEFRKREPLPRYVYHTLRAIPIDVHPMAQLAAAILSLQRDSVFAKEYEKGLPREKQWDYYFEDSMNLMAKLPAIAANIYRRCYKGDTYPDPDPKEDWAGQFSHLMGVDSPAYKELMRLFLILHSDHESGNVSAHTGHLVGSALSDVYYSIGAMVCGLAGPLHGLANEECLKWILKMMDHFGGTPTREQIEEYAWETLNSGQVVPGFGHAVLRVVDPRYTAQREFALNHLPDDPVFKTVSTMLDVVPQVLQKHGKAKNPWPNVDAHSGCLQYHFGVREFSFYTVLFAVSRAIGVTAELVYDRAVGFPIERPKSLTVDMLRDLAREVKSKAEAGKKPSMGVIKGGGSE
ncbi:MAG: citrate (Si)-synthase [Nitrospirota bacterium]|nr:citrate (Si)-synthase [Nitrospirota bacterium]